MSVDEAAEIAQEALEKAVGDLAIDKETDENSQSSNTKHNRRHSRNGRKGYFIPNEVRLKNWDTKMKEKEHELVQEGVTGIVKWYSVLGHYGFISRENGEEDVFVHQSAIAKSKTEKPYLRSLANNETVVFDLVKGQQGLEAIHVTGPDGTNVQGARYAFKFLLGNRLQKKGKKSDRQSDSKTESSTDGTGGDALKRKSKGKAEGELNEKETADTKKPRKFYRKKSHKKNAEKVTAISTGEEIDCDGTPTDSAADANLGAESVAEN